MKYELHNTWNSNIETDYPAFFSLYKSKITVKDEDVPSYWIELEDYDLPVFVMNVFIYCDRHPVIFSVEYAKEEENLSIMSLEIYDNYRE